MSSEQWLEDGDCERCRRKKYCSKPCAANKRFETARLTEMMCETVANVLNNTERKDHGEHQNQP